jgi:hypothetical protein
MSVLVALHLFLTYSSVAAALASAFYWWRGSTIELFEGDPKSKGPMLIDREDGKGQFDPVSTAMEQSRLNKIAALWTAAAAVLGAVASVT